MHLPPLSQSVSRSLTDMFTLCWNKVICFNEQKQENEKKSSLRENAPEFSRYLHASKVSVLYSVKQFGEEKFRATRTYCSGWCWTTPFQQTKPRSFSVLQIHSGSKGSHQNVSFRFPRKTKTLLQSAYNTRQCSDDQITRTSAFLEQLKMRQPSKAMELFLARPR